MTSPEAAELAAVDAALAGREVPREHADLAALALLLRDDRPEPSGQWILAMDQRVRAGFPPRRRRVRRPAWLWPLALAAAALALPLLVTLAVVAGGPFGGTDDPGGGAVGGAEMDAAESAGGATAPEDSAGSVAPPDIAVPPVPPPGGDPRSDGRRNRVVERAAALTLATEAAEVDRAAARASRVAAVLGGFVAYASTSTEGGTLELRVPAARLDTAIQRLSALGDVRELTRDTLDITGETVSARAQLREARADRRGLLRQLARAATVEVSDAIRERLRRVGREIAAARGRVRTVANRARYATLSVTLVSEAHVPGEEDGVWTPGDAVRDARRVLEVVAGVALVAVAALAPLGLAATLWWLARGAAARRRRERALDAA